MRKTASPPVAVLLGLGLLASSAALAEPVVLGDGELDQVSAGQAIIILAFGTSSTDPGLNLFENGHATPRDGREISRFATQGGASEIALLLPAVQSGRTPRSGAGSSPTITFTGLE
jgi:hypothetical protein